MEGGGGQGEDIPDSEQDLDNGIVDEDEDELETKEETESDISTCTVCSQADKKGMVPRIQIEATVMLAWGMHGEAKEKLRTARAEAKAAVGHLD